MNWKDYEIEILDYFTSQFPNAEIRHNVFIEGRYSKVQRQIDILIEDYVAGNRMRIIIDGKYYSKNIDVKDVEMFIGMLNDCEANKGLLITQEGFSQAAINRAYFDAIDIELDIFNSKELLEFQGFTSIPYSDNNGVILPAPFGWIIDSIQRQGALCTLYQRGLSLEKAQKQKEWMYVNLYKKDESVNSIDDLLNIQNKDIINDFPDADIKYLPTIKRNDAQIKLRVCNISSYPTKEYTGFVEFKEFIFFCVLFSPEELKRKNIRKLESIMQQVMNLQVIVDSFVWDIERHENGALMYLEVPYTYGTETDVEYMTLTVAKKYSKERPDFISIILPNNILSELGIRILFSKTEKTDSDNMTLERDNNITEVQIESSTKETCTFRIVEGFVLNTETNTKIDLLAKLLEFDHLFVNFTLNDRRQKSVSVPLYSLKKQYNELKNGSR